MLRLCLDQGFGERKRNENGKGRWFNCPEWLDRLTFPFLLLFFHTKSRIQTQLKCFVNTNPISKFTTCWFNMVSFCLFMLFNSSNNPLSAWMKCIYVTHSHGLYTHEKMLVNCFHPCIQLSAIVCNERIIHSIFDILNPFVQGEPCDICGDIGVLEAIFECSRCKIAHEHV